MLKSIRRAAKIFNVSGGLWGTSLLMDRAGIPVLGLWPEFVVSADILAQQVGAILSTWGMPEDHRETATGHLIYADLHGIDSHGVGMLLQYYRDFKAGNLSMNPKVEVVRESASTALVDGGGGLGHVAGNLAMKLAIDKCRSTGCGIVAVRNSTHYGAAGSYASMAAGAGFLGLSMTSTPQPAVVPTFGIDSMLGTNPISFAAPAGRNNPFLLDMATSTIPFGALMKFWRNGHSIPEGWALDDTGRPVTNARKAAGYRRLSPLGSSREMGGHKGYGLAAMVEILSSILPGRPLPAESGKSTGRVGHFFLVLDPNRFRAKGEFESDLDLMLDALRDGKRVNPEQPILVAGDPEYRAREERAGKGIPISRSIVEDIRMVCGDSGAPFILELK